DPGPERRFVPQRIEPGVDPGEHLLERILCVGLLAPKTAAADRVDVAREPLHEEVPGRVVALTTAPDELGVTRGDLRAHSRMRLRRRGAVGECEARTQGAFVPEGTGATEDAASRRTASPDGTKFPGRSSYS